MNRARYRHSLLPRLDKLQHRHLRGRILHGHTIGPQCQHGFPAFPNLGIKIIRVRNENFLRQGERSTKFFPGLLDNCRH